MTLILDERDTGERDTDLRDSLEHIDRTTQWIAYHVFYGGSPDVLLTECLIPLADRLVQAGIARDWFYINYWLEGSHVRLRLRVDGGMPASELDAHVMPVVREYLARKPSMHPMRELADNGFYERLFVGEFRDEDRPQYFDADGEPKFRENNSIERRPYEREIYRYGGSASMILAEAHFVKSTSLACDVMDRGNQEVRTLLLGIAAQLSFATASALLRDRELVADFFVAYHQRWATGYTDGTMYTTERGRRKHALTATRLRTKMLPLFDQVIDGDLSALPARLRGWTRFNMHTRDQLDELFASGHLVFDYQDGRRAPESAVAAAWSLCHSLIHMTNNRMMVSVADEAFLAYQIADAMGAEQ